jgi:hypothetical protein
MTMPGIPAGGLKTVGQIDATNSLVFYAGQNGLEIAVPCVQPTRLARRWWMRTANISGSSTSLMS